MTAKNQSTTATTRKGWLHEDALCLDLPTPCDDHRPMAGEHGFCGHCGWNGVAHSGSPSPRQRAEATVGKALADHLYRESDSGRNETGW